MEDVLGTRIGNAFKGLGLSVCVIGLTACAEMSHVWDGMTTTKVTMREDNGNVSAPLTPELQDSNESFMPSAPVGYQLQGGVTPMAPPPAFAGAMDPNISSMNTSGDSSVTIFPLDGAPVAPSMSLGGPSPSQMDLQGGSYYAPAGSYSGGTPDAQIFFNHGSSRLGSSDMRKISSVAQSAPMVNGRIAVEGHASRSAQTSDPVKGSILNLKESMNRAYAVSKTLIQKGVPANKLKTTAYGDTVPVGSEQQQRRVDIISGGY